MGKRSNFKRVERDFYPTPLKAAIPLIPHIKDVSTFVEPCAGDGSLIDILEDHGLSCTSACDEVGGQCIITNPPWDRKLLHKLIPLFTALRPTWLLFDADWLYTVQSAEFLPLLKKVVAVGRVKWIPDSASQGKDNASWYFFNNRIKKDPEFVSFYGRVDLNNP